MKYEFHVGDYVETIGGFVGWIYRTRDDGHIWVANKDVSSFCYRIPEDLGYFKRIGQYDFTKKDEGKIEKIDVKKAGSVFTRRETAIIDTISNKINELVEAVNELKDKND